MTPSDPKEALERLKAENTTLRASLKWVPQVQPGHLNGGAYVSMTWGEFNGMREAIGLRPATYRGSDAKAATNAVNMALRVKLETAEADRAALIAKQEGLEREVERLTPFEEAASTWAISCGVARGERDLAEAQLSVLKEVLGRITRLKSSGGLSLARALAERALLPTVPVEPGLGPQLREFSDTLSVGTVLRQEFFPDPSVPVEGSCPTCGGSGKRPGGEWNCEACDGNGGRS